MQAMLGANAGYVADGHDSLNHFQLRAYVCFCLRGQLELYTYIGYNQTIKRDVFRYTGVGFNYLF